MLTGFKNAGRMPSQVIVSDPNADTLTSLKTAFPEIHTTMDNQEPAKADVVFVAVHPPAMKEVLCPIAPCLKADACVISLVPKMTIAKLSEWLNGFQRIIRMIPNAPAIVNRGYNPVVFAPAIPSADKTEMLELFKALGDCPQVPEATLEAYAIVTAMGPTYF